MYRAIYRALLGHLPPEAAHLAGFWLIRAAAAVPGVAWVLRRFLAPRDPSLRVHALGLDFPGPLGLAAGFDKDGVGITGLAALGFSFVEVGTVTARPQPGNPKPRMFRFAEERALVNRMGFNNHGAAALAGRLRALRASGRQLPVIGVNIGKTKAVPEPEAVADYVTSARLVADVADYVVVNVSSPNTPGLRDLQAVDKLAPILTAVREALDEASPRRRVPLLVKIAPDLASADIDAVADLALGLGLDGIIATNTTISREGLKDTAMAADAGPGGMSGAPLKERALAVLRQLQARTGGRLTLIAAGGIETPEDALERIQAGAALVQAYTAFIYQGPLWPHRVQKRVAAKLGGNALALDRQVPGFQGERERVGQLDRAAGRHRGRAGVLVTHRVAEQRYATLLTVNEQVKGDASGRVGTGLRMTVVQRRGRRDLDHHGDTRRRHPRRRVEEQISLLGREGDVRDDHALPLDGRNDQALVPGEVHRGGAASENLLDDTHDAAFMVAVRGWRHDDLSVNELGSVALGGFQGEKVLQYGVPLRVRFTGHDNHVPLLPRGT